MLSAEKFNLKYISMRRNIIYTFSMLFLVLNHSSLDFPIPLFQSIKKIGELGVDSFLLVSGISLYFSFAKNSNLHRFYVQRARRILPSLIMVSGAYFFQFYVMREHSWGNFFLHFSGISLFVNGSRFFWYAYAIIIFYAVYPLIYRFFSLRRFSQGSLFVAVCSVLAFNLIIRVMFPVFFGNCEILLRRAPIFVFGCWLGFYVYNKCSLPVSCRTINIAGLLFLAVYLVIRFRILPDGLAVRRYLGSVLGVIIVISTSTVNLADGNLSVIADKAIGFLSKITFEIYLTHERILSILVNRSSSETGVILNIAAFVLSAFFSWFLLWIGNKVLFFTDRIMLKNNKE